MKDKIKLAIYDVDYTIISINSLVKFLIYIFLRNPISIIYIPYINFMLLLWSIRIIPTKKIKSILLLPLKNFDRQKIDNMMNDFTKKKLFPFIKPGAITSINNLKNEGYKIVLSSASYEIYIKHLAAYLKADYFFGTKISFSNNKLNTKIDGENCKGKEKINRILKIIPEIKIDKKNSLGFSDHISDIYFLKISEKFFKVKLKKWEIKKTYFRDQYIK